MMEAVDLNQEPRDETPDEPYEPPDVVVLGNLEDTLGTVGVEFDGGQQISAPVL